MKNVKKLRRFILYLKSYERPQLWSIAKFMVRLKRCRELTELLIRSTIGSYNKVLYKNRQISEYPGCYVIEFGKSDTQSSLLTPTD